MPLLLLVTRSRERSLSLLMHQLLLHSRPDELIGMARRAESVCAGTPSSPCAGTSSVRGDAIDAIEPVRARTCAWPGRAGTGWHRADPPQGGHCSRATSCSRAASAILLPPCGNPLAGADPGSPLPLPLPLASCALAAIALAAALRAHVAVQMADAPQMATQKIKY